MRQKGGKEKKRYASRRGIEKVERPGKKEKGRVGCYHYNPLRGKKDYLNARDDSAEKKGKRTRRQGEDIASRSETSETEEKRNLGAGPGRISLRRQTAPEGM